MTRLALAACLALVAVPLPARADPPKADDAKQLDAEYRKLDGLLVHLRARNAERYAITTPRGIDEAGFVPIGGIDQWITIRGQDRDNPVILFLHGGPGEVTTPWAFALFADWERRFTVVQWDQRGAGRTLKRSGPGGTDALTIDRLADDGVELAEHLRRRLGKDKVILVAHSFGTIIGLGMARRRPELFYAFVGTGQVADEKRNDQVAYAELLRRARAAGATGAVAELEKAGPPPAGYGVQRKWALSFEGGDRFLLGTIGLALVAPGYTVEDFNDSVAGQMASAERLVPASRSLGLGGLGLSFAVPIFVIQGADDLVTPTSLARDYVALLRAPRKAFVTLAGAGHFAVFTRSDAFLKELVARVRPLAR